MLSETILRQISRNSGASFNFDFSSIHSDLYESLFKTLQRYALNNIESLGCNCDEMAKYESAVVKGSPLPKKIRHSIAKTKANYIRNMIELLCYVIPKSKRIKEVHFSNILLPADQFERLAISFSKSTSLQLIEFNRVLLENDGLKIFLNTLDPNHLTYLSFVRCGLNDDIADDIIQFIFRKESFDIGIKSFEVSPDEFSDSARQRIASAISAFKSGQSFSSQITPQKDSLSSGIKINDQERTERLENLQQLKDENRSLKNQIKALKEMVNAVQFGESLFVVGQGAPEFVMYLNDIEQRLVDLDS